MKRVASIQDISGFGKCSLTVAIPIISAMGVEISVIPTAILSTHTGGFENYTYRDLTEDIIPFVEHWESLEINFDALYTGFLGSVDQIEIISSVFTKLKGENTLILVDPVMGDDGELYSSFTNDIVLEMKKLCTKADIIVPNITEALFLLGYEYREGPYEKSFIGKILLELSDLGIGKIVITGINFSSEEIGVAIFDKEKESFDYVSTKKIEAQYPGTGDIFSSVLLGCLLNNIDLTTSCQMAVDFVFDSIVKTKLQGKDPRYGVNFEKVLPNLVKELFF